MDSKYITLFKDLAQATAASAEAVMDYDRQQNDEQGLKTATTMRDDFQSLTDRLAANEYSMTKGDAAKLLVGTIIQIDQVKKRIEALKSALTGYQTDIMPKLQAIMDEAENDKAAAKMADEKFIIEDNK